MSSKSQSHISDRELATVRALAAEGRPIPAIIMAAIVKRLEAEARTCDVPDEG